MNGQESIQNEAETASGYLNSVLRYMQNGGKLTSIEATAAETLRLHAEELGHGLESPVNASVGASILRAAVEHLRLRHNNLAADEVFRDLMDMATKLGQEGRSK
jgi:hypothetical protein